jgi:hypothetical protein
VYWITKTLITALVIVGVSEIAKRLPVFAAILASLPLISILSMVWLFIDTGDSQKIISLSYGIFWAVLPSLVFFIALPLLLKGGLKFGLAMPVACLIMFGFYSLYVLIIKKFGITL